MFGLIHKIKENFSRAELGLRGLLRFSPEIFIIPFPLWLWNCGEHLSLGKVFLMQRQNWLLFYFPKALQPRTKAVYILCWIELLSLVTLADKLINRGEDKGAENSTAVHFRCCICLFQLRVEELPLHKGILKRLNEAGGKALGSASLNPEVKHKLDTRLKEANHRWIKVRHMCALCVCISLSVICYKSFQCFFSRAFLVCFDFFLCAYPDLPVHLYIFEK